ncbi:MAG TPA: competence/damage-inducible protein A [Dehalococcoidia bacterium]|nr:competence/damage-inducible protein A [Dehalococcoidia bacterium]
MKAEIFAIGTEILFGQIVDTNSTWLAGRLPALGIDLYYISTMGDNQARMVECLRRAWDRSDLIITTGGLGPTEDDLTREAIAELLGEPMTREPGLEEALRERWRRRGMPMPERNLKQAALIASATAIPNPRGSAPGWWVERDGRTIVSMPGVRNEMYLMWEEQVEPRLRERSDGTIILSRNIKTSGLSEALVDEMVSPLLSSANPTIGVYAKVDGIHLRLSAKAPRRAEAEGLLKELEGKVRAILKDAVWGVDEETPEGAVGTLLKERGLTVATMESCTGGLLASTITDVPGSSGYFKGGIVSYTNEVKIEAGVSPKTIEKHGAVSPETAIEMAGAVRMKLGADVGMAITGVAGPDPLEGKPPGTVYIGLVTAQDQRATSGGIYLPNRPDIKQRATVNALLFLRRYLLGME